MSTALALAVTEEQAVTQRQFTGDFGKGGLVDEIGTQA